MNSVVITAYTPTGPTMEERDAYEAFGGVLDNHLVAIGGVLVWGGKLDDLSTGDCRLLVRVEAFSNSTGSFGEKARDAVFLAAVECGGLGNATRVILGSQLMTAAEWEESRQEPVATN